MKLYFLRHFVLKILNSNYVNRWWIFAFDVVGSILSSAIAFSLLFYILPNTLDIRDATSILIYSACISVASFLLLQTYRNIIRHSTLQDVWRFILAAFLKVLLVFFLCSISGPLFPVKILYIGSFLDFIFTCFVLIGSRIALLNIYHYVLKFYQLKKKRALLVFSNDANTWASLINNEIQNPYFIAGFLDPSARSKNSSYRISGLSVYCISNIESLEDLIREEHIDCVFFRSQEELRSHGNLVEICNECGLKIYVLPPLNPMGAKEINLRLIKEVCIEDLLGRDEIQIDYTEISNFLSDKVILVTGGAGSIGSELCRQMAQFPIKQLVIFDSAETAVHNIRLELEEKFPNLNFFAMVGDIRSIARVDHVFKRFCPHIVFHAAAYKHVPLMEANPCEAVRTNVYGTFNLANHAIAYNIERFIMVSTDKAVNPTNIMGASKRLAEIYVQSLSTAIGKGIHPGKTEFITTRFGNVLGSSGSVIPRFRAQLENGGPITVTHPDITRFFMTIREACRLVLQASYIGKTSEILVFDMGESVKIVDLAKRMIKLAGMKEGVDMDIKFTGLRPGEKLYEEVLNDNENTIPTQHQKIRIANVREYEFEEINTKIQELSELSRKVQIPETVKLMKILVPEFISKNSEFERFDIPK